MFCPKCGQQNPDNAKLCCNCATPFNPPAQAPRQPEVKKSNNSVIIAAIICVTVIVVAVAAIVLVPKFLSKDNGDGAKENPTEYVGDTGENSQTGSTDSASDTTDNTGISSGINYQDPEELAKTLINAILNGDADTAFKCMSDDVLRAIAESDEMTLDEWKQEYKKDTIDDEHEDIVDEYDSYTISLSVKEVMDYDGDDFEELKEEFAEYGINVSAAKGVLIFVKVEGKRGSEVCDPEEYNVPVYLVKIGSSWSAMPVQ